MSPALRVSRRRLLVLPLLLLLSLAVLLSAIVAGDLTTGIGEALGAVFGTGQGVAADIVRELRLPRAIGTFACGGMLAISGVLMQVLLRNPLADPYVLGISGGAAVGALLAMMAGLSMWVVEAAALAGALGVMLAVLGLAHGSGSWTPTRMLLTGVIISAGCGAVIALLLSITPARSLPGMLFWLMGDASNIAHPGAAMGVLAAATVLLLPLARDLNLLATGSLSAQALGVSVGTLRLFIYLIASLLTALSVSSVGAVGFVGLVVPHLLRLSIGADHRLLLPASALAGGSLLTAADTCARTLVSPLQLPVGVLMALIGVPLFLLLLTREGRRS